MSESNKTEMARELLELVSAVSAFEDHGDSTGLGEYYEQFSRLQLDALAELYAAHFSEEQLRFQLDHHKSDMGRSILEIHNKLKPEYARVLARVSEEMNERMASDGVNAPTGLRIESSSGSGSRRND